MLASHSLCASDSENSELMMLLEIDAIESTSSWSEGSAWSARMKDSDADIVWVLGASCWWARGRRMVRTGRSETKTYRASNPRIGSAEVVRSTDTTKRTSTTGNVDKRRKVKVGRTSTP
jgi:hypothetical protein